MPSAAKSALTLIVGSEPLLVERAIDDVVSRVRKADPQTERRDLDGSEAGVIGLIDEACSPTLFGGGAVVVVSNLESADENTVTALVSVAKQATAEVSIVGIHAGGARGKKLLVQLEHAAGHRVECPEIKKGRAVTDFVAAEMRRLNRSMSPQAQAILIAAVGSDIRALASACNQLANDVDAREIEADDVSKYFGGTVDITGFQIADAVMNRQNAQALRLLRLAEGTDGSRLGPATVASLTNSIRQLVAVSTAPPGMSDRELAADAKVPPWKLRTLHQQVRRWSQLDLAQAILILGDLDAAMKGGLRDGEQLEPVQKGLALESAVVSLARQ